MPRVTSSLRPRYAVLTAEEVAAEKARAPAPSGWLGGMAGLFGRRRASVGQAVGEAGGAGSLDPDLPPPVAPASLTLVDVEGAEFPAQVMTGGQWEAMGEGGRAQYMDYLASLGIVAQ